MQGYSPSDANTEGIVKTTKRTLLKIGNGSVDDFANRSNIHANIITGELGEVACQLTLSSIPVALDHRKGKLPSVFLKL
jgi:hypothetical protein